MHQTATRRPAILDQLSRRTYETLRDRILSGELPAGQRLAARELAGSLGVSITPVRDAFHRLAADGLVAVSPRRGTYVTSLTTRDVRELYDLRIMLEPAAAEIAALSLSEDELAAIRQVTEKLVPFDAAGASGAAYYADRHLHREFHRLIVRGARNRRLDALHEEIQAGLAVIRGEVYPRTFAQGDRFRRIHLEIVEALEARDPSLARARLATHLVQSRDDLLRHMQAAGGAAAPADSATPTVGQGAVP